MRFITGIDPGKSKGLAYAVVDTERKRLHKCGIVTAPTLAEQGHRLAQDLLGFGRVHAVCELPIWHKPKPSDPRFINPNDLIALAASGGVAVGVMASVGCTSEFVYPHDWKGQRPKDVHNRYVRNLLSVEEAEMFLHSFSTKALQNDVLDAIGIAFWKVGRK